jgi:hypothetical protein
MPGLPGRSPVPSGLFKSPNLEGYTTAMNVSQYEGLGADGIMANDNGGLHRMLWHFRKQSPPALFLLSSPAKARRAGDVRTSARGSKSSILWSRNVTINAHRVLESCPLSAREKLTLCAKCHSGTISRRSVLSRS